MRGALISSSRKLAKSGIIPADAGSTGNVGSVTMPEEDHPRGCGEHKFSPIDTAFRWGSSPRMRGAHIDNSVWPQIVGIIPADAGSTSGLLLSSV